MKNSVFKCVWVWIDNQPERVVEASARCNWCFSGCNETSGVREKKLVIKSGSHFTFTPSKWEIKMLSLTDFEICIYHEQPNPGDSLNLSKARNV